MSISHTLYKDIILHWFKEENKKCNTDNVVLKRSYSYRYNNYYNITKMRSLFDCNVKNVQ